MWSMILWLGVGIVHYMKGLISDREQGLKLFTIKNSRICLFSIQLQVSGEIIKNQLRTPGKMSIFFF